MAAGPNELTGLQAAATQQRQRDYAGPPLETVFESTDDAMRHRRRLRVMAVRNLALRVLAYTAAAALLVMCVRAVADDDFAKIGTSSKSNLLVGDFVCPGSPATVHASCKLSIRVEAPCGAVAEEILARVDGQFDKWHDPHNNGTYHVVSDAALRKQIADRRSALSLRGAHTIVLTRRTGDDKYTDRIALTLEAVGEGDEGDEGEEMCLVSGCSESQVFSIGDYGTNYCNMRNLICGSKAEPSCAFVKHDLTAHMHHVMPSIGATVNERLCNTM